jgi:hypothetical protein
MISPYDELAFDELNFYKLTFDELTFDELTFDDFALHSWTITTEDALPSFYDAFLRIEPLNLLPSQQFHRAVS